MELPPKKKMSLALHFLAAAAVMIAVFLISWLVPDGIIALAEENAPEASEENIEGTVITFTNTKNTSPGPEGTVITFTNTKNASPSPGGTVITFTNTKNTSSSLYVTKSIQTPSGDTVDYSDYSDVEFTFTLSLDGTAAKQIEYTVWDESGKQVFLYEDGTESTEEKSNAVAYLTSRYGVFTLRAGQTAKFSDLGAGMSYEVEEEETDGFTQIVPSGGANAVGTIASDGSVAAFTNLVKTETEPEPEKEKSGIKVYKTVSFPDGWTIPETPAFSFTITVDGGELVLEDYEVYDTETNTFKETRVTDADGVFTLYGGEYALFETDANVDYEITEHEMPGWRTTTDDTVSGSTGESIQTVVFNNASASFIVTKTLTDGSEETGDDFIFLLTDNTGIAMAGAVYWLYDIYGNPQTDSNGDVLSYITNTDGSFTLKAGQAAVFYGIEAGTQYSVSEVTVKGWNQVVPTSATGYTGKTVSGVVEILPFENEAVDLTGTLTVTKIVEEASALAAPADDEFTFVLCNGNGDPVAGAVYSVTIGSDVYTYKTDASGTFSIHAGETAAFSSLPYGMYSVEEIAVPERTHETYKFSSVTVQDGESNTTCENDGAAGTLGEDGLAFEYTNTYTAPSSITIYKYQNDGVTLLPDVTFTLSDADGNVLSEQTTGKDGKICFDKLNAGTYTITETSTQDGHALLVNSFAVTVPLTVTKDEVKAAGTDTTDAVWREDTNLWYFFDLTYNITNSAVLDLPETGGNGWFLPVIIGAAMITLFTILMLYRRKRVRNGSAKKRKIGTILRKCFGIFLILAGLCFYLYPVVSEALLTYHTNTVIQEFKERFGISNTDMDEPEVEEEQEEETLYAVQNTETVTEEEKDALYQACFAYNCRIYAASQSGLKDVESYEEYDLGEEAMELLDDGLFGYIEIPAMDVKLPLYLGSSTEHMAAGASVLGETSAPIGGLNTNAVISGHRGYRGSPYFREIELLESGDVVYVTNPWETLTYVVSEIDIINPSDADAVKIQEGRDMITLLTCHPYRSGGTYRYVVYCDRLAEENEETAEENPEEETAALTTIPAVGADEGAYIIASSGTAYASSEKDIQTEQLLRKGSAVFLLILLVFYLVRSWIYKILAWKQKRKRAYK